MVAQRINHRPRHVNYSHGSFLPLPPAPFPAAYEARKPSAVLGVAEDPGLAQLQHLRGDSWATAAGIRETARLARGSADSRRPGWTAGCSRMSKTAMMRLAGWPTGDENACRLPAREAKEGRSLDLASLLVLYQEYGHALFWWCPLGPSRKYDGKLISCKCVVRISSSGRRWLKRAKLLRREEAREEEREEPPAKRD